MSDNPNEFSTRWGIRMPDGSMFKSPYSGAVVTWNDRERAEEILEQLRTQSAFIGVTDYKGCVVRQLCTPFVSDTDNVDHLMDQLSAWLTQQTGSGS